MVCTLITAQITILFVCMTLRTACMHCYHQNLRELSPTKLNKINLEQS